MQPVVGAPPATTPKRRVVRRSAAGRTGRPSPKGHGRMERSEAVRLNIYTPPTGAHKRTAAALGAAVAAGTAPGRSLLVVWTRLVRFGLETVVRRPRRARQEGGACQAWGSTIHGADDAPASAARAAQAGDHAGGRACAPHVALAAGAAPPAKGAPTSQDGDRRQVNAARRPVPCLPRLPAPVPLAVVLARAAAARGLPAPTPLR